MCFNNYTLYLKMNKGLSGFNELCLHNFNITFVFFKNFNFCTCIWILSRLKRTSPTAYCDCWEKCKCKTLIAGQKSARLDLLYRLLTATNLVTLPNSRQVGFLGHKLGWKSTAHLNYLPQQCSVLQRGTPLTVFSADGCQADSRALPVQASSNPGGS